MPKIDFYSIVEWFEPLGWIAGLIVTGVVTGLLAHWLIWQSLKQVSQKTRTILDDVFYRGWRRPTRYAFIILAIYILLPLIGRHVPENYTGATDGILKALLIKSH